MDDINNGGPAIEPIRFSDQLAKTVLNSLSANIAILDENGVILETNQAWREYATANAMEGPVDSIGVNYLKLCDATTGKEARDAKNVAAGIRAVIRGETKEFLYDYPCHGQDGRHFYYLRAIRVDGIEPTRVVVSHEDITALKLAEEALVKREHERDRLRHSLELAREVQQKLLPKKYPNIAGLDIAGRSIYCDETGGDYYDFIPFNQDGKEKLTVVVGDVSGHGISSALIMAAVRASLRQRSYLSGSISQIVADVNHQMAADVGDSGQFITLFYLSIDPVKRVLKWVRAGHEPAIFYDPATGQYEDLAGEGVALGVDQHARYEENEKGKFNTGSIIVLGTDGIWESRNSNGEMLGKGVINEIIRENASRSATEILEAVITNIRKFQAGLKSEDDLTLVVVKATDIYSIFNSGASGLDHLLGKS
jgi:serine phosphatase RsbU (regulator of sigma subunit)